MTGIWIVIDGAPRTKKNSQKLVRAGGRTIPIQSDAYRQYERDCIIQIGAMRHNIPASLPIGGRINLKCEYWMPTRRRVDLVNLIEATNDILVRAGVIEDDNATIVAGHDGSRVRYDKSRPRVEITITELNQ